jgi:hypothetical protein
MVRAIGVEYRHENSNKYKGNNPAGSIFARGQRKNK